MRARATSWKPTLAWALPLAAFAMITMWPADTLEPGAGIDPSWTAGLSLARRAGLQFGPDIVFTYGPLGYALFPSNISRSGLLVSVVALGAICGSFAVITARVLRTSLQDLSLIHI